MDDHPVDPPKTAIELAGLTVRFGRRAVLCGVDLAIRERGITVVVGPSGSGKTTLLRAINRLNECFAECRTEGTVRLHFEDGCWDAYANGKPVAELRRRVGMVFQTPNVLPCSIQKNLTLPLTRVLGVSRRILPERVEAALRQVELWSEVRDRLGDPATTLSGGQQQRLCLARALVLEPQMLLLDEPTSSLDFRATRVIEQLLLRLRRDYTIVAVSHSLGQTRRLADDVLVLGGGRVTRRLERAQLACPETFQELLEEVF